MVNITQVTNSTIKVVVNGLRNDSGQNPFREIGRFRSRLDFPLTQVERSEKGADLSVFQGVYWSRRRKSGEESTVNRSTFYSR